MLGAPGSDNPFCLMVDKKYYFLPIFNDLVAWQQQLLVQIAKYSAI